MNLNYEAYDQHENIILSGIVGSTAYGLGTPDSDLDRLGIFRAPLRDVVLGDARNKTIVRTNPDVALHEVHKFVHLAAKGNPTITELLWLGHYEIITEAGGYLIHCRKSLLSQAARYSYGGYARKQAEKLRETGKFKAKYNKRKEKHGRHCYRLLIQGIHLMETGEVLVRLDEAQAAACVAAGKMAVENYERFYEIVNDLDHKLQTIDSNPLPERVSQGLIDQIIWHIRTSF